MKNNLPKYKAKYKKRRVAYIKGFIAEYIAAIFLFLKFYRTISFRTRSHFGEIDIIAISYLPNVKQIIFVEVKYRKNFAAALDSIDYRKNKHFLAAVKYWIARNETVYSSIKFSYRIDVIVLNRFFLLKHIKNINLADI